MKIALLHNLNSGRSRKVKRPVGLLQARTSSEEEALDALRDFAQKGIDILAIYGGDGTVDTTIKLMRTHNIFETEPALAVLKGGTTNMTWCDIGIKNIDKLRKARRIQTTQRGVIKASAAGQDTQYGFFFGLGAIPKAISYTKQNLHSKGIKGPLGEGFMIASLFQKLFNGRIDQHPILKPSRLNDVEHNVFFIATTLNRLLLGLKPALPHENIGCVWLNAPYKKLWYNLRKLFADPYRKTTKESGLVRSYEREIELCFNGAWTLDGELFEATDQAPLTLTLDKPATFVQL